MILRAVSGVALNSAKPLNVDIYSGAVKLDRRVISPYDEEPNYCELPSSATKVTLRSSGDGVGRCQIECKYNKQPRATREASVLEASATLRIVKRYRRNKPSGMVMTEISALSGFKFNAEENEDYGRMSNEAMKKLPYYGNGDTTAYTMIAKIDNMHSKCIVKELIRTGDIDDPRPRPIYAYLVDEPSAETIINYSMKDLK